MRRDLDGNACSFQGFARHEALVARARRDARDAGDGTEQVDEVGDVIGAHIEHRAAAGEIVEAGIGMPTLVAGTHEEGRPADRPANEPVVDALARGLMRAAEESVGRRSEPQALRAGRVDELPGLRESDAERLLGMDVLARGDRLEAHLDMRFGHGEVEDDLDRGIGQHRLDRLRGDAELSGRAPPRRRGSCRRARRCRGSGTSSRP